MKDVEKDLKSKLTDFDLHKNKILMQNRELKRVIEDLRQQIQKLPKDFSGVLLNEDDYDHFQVNKAQLMQLAKV